MTRRSFLAASAAARLGEPGRPSKRETGAAVRQTCCTFWQVSAAGLLPAETWSYVPAVLAAMQLLGPAGRFPHLLETIYFGAIRCIQAVMRERGSGAIINVTSVARKISSSPFGPYSASKFALEALSEALAQELRAFA